MFLVSMTIRVPTLPSNMQDSGKDDTVSCLRTRALLSLDIGTPEVHSAIVREAESTHIPIAIQHMLILVIASLKSETEITANCHVSVNQYNIRLPQNTWVVPNWVHRA